MSTGGRLSSAASGPAFERSFRAAFPELANAAVFVSHGPLALLHLRATGGSGYFRLSVAQPYLDDRRLYAVPDAPVFAHSMHLVYSNRCETMLIERMREGILAASARHQLRLLESVGEVRTASARSESGGK